MNTPTGRNTGVCIRRKEYQDAQPPTDSPVGRRLEGYTHRVRSRAPAGKSKSPRPFYSNRLGAGGLLSGTNIRVPEEEKLMTIKH